MSLKVTYRGQELVLDEGSSALIGSGDGSTIQIARPGISRRHLAVAYDGSKWKIEDAGSRNGTFAGGERIQVTTIDGSTSVVLGHPTEGEVVEFTDLSAASAGESDNLQAEIDAFVLPDTPPDDPEYARASAPTKTTAAVTAGAAGAGTARKPGTMTSATGNSDQLTAAINDQIAAIKGLTWSVWAMIAVTAALCVLTLFVGILGG